MYKSFIKDGLCPHCGDELIEEFLPRLESNGLVTLKHEHLSAMIYKSKMDKIDLINQKQVKLFVFFDDSHRLNYIQDVLAEKVGKISSNQLDRLLRSDDMLKNIDKITSNNQGDELALLVSLVKNENRFWSGGMINIYSFTQEIIKNGQWLILIMIMQIGAGFTVPDLAEVCMLIVQSKHSSSESDFSVIHVLRDVLTKTKEKHQKETVELFIKSFNEDILIELVPDFRMKMSLNEIAACAVEQRSVGFLYHLICEYPNDLLEPEHNLLEAIRSTGDTSLVSFTLNQYNRCYKISRPTTNASTIKSATDALSLFNQVAQSREIKFTSNIMSTDISGGREHTRVRLVNDFDDLTPSEWQYASKSKPLLDLKVDESIQSQQSCNCKDGDCTDPKVCNCVLLSEGRSFSDYGRLQGKLYTGNEYELIPVIYECSELCGCPSSCLNKVRRMPKGSSAVEVFRTEKMGWGMRATQEIGRGTLLGTIQASNFNLKFLGEYGGEIITNNEADERNDTCKLVCLILDNYYS